MRLIGHLPTEFGASVFSNYLKVQGISNEVESDTEGWGVWIHSEDELDRATELFSRYQRNPEDPVYEKSGRQAREIRAREAEIQAARDDRLHDRKRVFSSMNPYGAGPFTMVLIGVSVAATLMFWFDKDGEVGRTLYISNMRGRGLPEVRTGEVWRLLTPIFLHGSRGQIMFGVIHLLFNMQWLFHLGSMIEARQGTRLLAMMALVIGVISNLAQYMSSGPNFVGMSGVVYGLLGYIWMMGRYAPQVGLGLHQQTVTMMLLWFVLCFTPLIPRVANTAHASGLALGVIWGLIGSWFASRKA